LEEDGIELAPERLHGERSCAAKEKLTAGKQTAQF